MAEIFSGIQKIKFEGAKSKNPLAFKYYDANKVVAGKKMKDHLRFAMAWWHNLSATGTDMFGSGTADKSFGAEPGTMEHAFAKVDAGFEFMDKIGIDFFCFHDADLVPEADDINETNERIDQVVDYIAKKKKTAGKKLLWGTANMFSKPQFMNGAGSSNSPDVYCFAAAQIKKALDATIKLDGAGYTFWGGREGYETLLNTDVKFELDNIARLMKASVAYARKKGWKGTFYIEPKPKEPMKHQYDYDAATAIGFLRQYGLDKDFKMNIEANHATLAGHTFQHDLRISAINGMLGSVDANQGDYLLGWDTDEFPFDVYETTWAMYEILNAGGFTTGGLNFDAKNRRPSYTHEDMFHGFILGMDAFALGLIKANALIKDGRIDKFIEEKYAGYKKGIGRKIVSGKATLEELSDRALKLKKPDLPGSGRQEYLEGIVNQVFFG
ncbi:MAG: xylose isomerase [Clostridiales Family XIII bacterium]|nr:xylose isomerase [Clostridiales Family XIII bacterium]